ncbi:MAG: hypothetical protein SNJ71_04200 [Bacteroidales bacterium]
MKTTLNLPDDLVLQAKRQALIEGSTLTDLLVQGLKIRLERSSQIPAELPVSKAKSGLVEGVSWDKLLSADLEITQEWYR